MIKTYKILSLLLSYPQKELKNFLPDCLKLLRQEELLEDKQMKGIQNFIDVFSNEELTKWQAHYVQLFDYSRTVSLHLFEHVHGDSRDRGQAMVDLIRFYEEAGLEWKTNELPDYLPAFLEFISLSPSTQMAAEILYEPITVIAKVHQKLQEKENAYQYIFSAIISLSAKQPEMDKVSSLIEAEKLMDLDKEYSEDPIRFGGDNGCSTCH